MKLKEIIKKENTSIKPLINLSNNYPLEASI